MYDELDCDIFETNIQENLEDQFVQEALNKVTIVIIVINPEI